MGVASLFCDAQWAAGARLWPVLGIWSDAAATLEQGPKGPVSSILSLQPHDGSHTGMDLGHSQLPSPRGLPHISPADGPSPLDWTPRNQSLRPLPGLS